MVSTIIQNACALDIIDLFADTAAILISIVSNSYYGMHRGQIHINFAPMYLPPEHPIMSFKTIEIKMASVSKGLLFQGVDRPNTTPIGQDMKFKDL